MYPELKTWVNVDPNRWKVEMCFLRIVLCQGRCCADVSSKVLFAFPKLPVLTQWEQHMLLLQPGAVLGVFALNKEPLRFAWQWLLLTAASNAACLTGMSCSCECKHRILGNQPIFVSLQILAYAEVCFRYALAQLGYLPWEARLGTFLDILVCCGNASFWVQAVQICITGAESVLKTIWDP